MDDLFLAKILQYHNHSGNQGLLSPFYHVLNLLQQFIDAVMVHIPDNDLINCFAI